MGLFYILCLKFLFFFDSSQYTIDVNDTLVVRWFDATMPPRQAFGDPSVVTVLHKMLSAEGFGLCSQSGLSSSLSSTNWDPRQNS